MQGIGPAATVALDAHTQLIEVREHPLPALPLANAPLHIAFVCERRRHNTNEC